MAEVVTAHALVHGARRERRAESARAALCVHVVGSDWATGAEALSLAGAQIVGDVFAAACVVICGAVADVGAAASIQIARAIGLPIATLVRRKDALFKWAT